MTEMQRQCIGCKYFHPDRCTCSHPNIFECKNGSLWWPKGEPVKPPLGLTPAPIWKDMRVHDILGAMMRYSDARLPIPLDWVVELKSLLNVVENTAKTDGEA